MIVLKKVFYSVHKTTIASLTCMAILGCQSTSSSVSPRLAPGVIVGSAVFRDFIVHENEPGFSELQTLFLASLSASSSVKPCCSSFPAGKEIELHLREPYYLLFGLESHLVTSVKLTWPALAGKPYFVLNEQYQLMPSEGSKSTTHLLIWAAARGYK